MVSRRNQRLRLAGRPPSRRGVEKTAFRIVLADDLFLTQRLRGRPQRDVIACMVRLPEPLIEDNIRGRCLAILGSGMSRNAVVPIGATMPLWPDLGKSLGKRMTDFPTGHERT
jgi:hypothetical protein